jgi:uncharacterized alpha/beta hydrolase family protein
MFWASCSRITITMRDDNTIIMSGYIYKTDKNPVIDQYIDENTAMKYYNRDRRVELLDYRTK